MRLELKNIHKSFGEKRVLRGISFEAESGSALGLLGRNGVGKTTAIRILMNVFPADSGEVLIDGKPTDYMEIGIGYLPEERGLYPKKKIIDQLVYFAELKGMKRDDAVKSVDYWLDRLGMTEYRNKRLDTLSKGNQQKIQLITAIAHDPDIIILDEPFSGLDPVNAMMLKDVVRDEIKREKIVLFSSHQMNYIEEFCDRIAILNGGEIVLSGELRDIKRSYPRDKLLIRSEEAERIINDLAGRFAECEVLGNGEILVKLTSQDEKRKLMSDLSLHYDIDELSVFEPALSDIFVEYAGAKSEDKR